MRRRPNNQFLMGTELELQTCVLSSQPPGSDLVLALFLDYMEGIAPSLPGPSGCFNGYGRVYLDCGGHIEMASCECASPCDLPGVVEKQQVLVGRVVDRLASEGHQLLLANNNYSGLLHSASPMWGSHENYLTDRRPSAPRFGQLILPFLVTRIHAGAGGIEFPSGRFLAGARPLQMALDCGGSTTGMRAIHSTCREEHHMGDCRARFRYHLIVADGHRSHFNLALQFATTALALKAMFHVHGFPSKVRALGAELSDATWVDTIQRFNVLCQPGAAWQVHPAVIDVQRIYLQAARQYADSLRDRPAWIEWALENWGRMLDAFESRDLDWLSARLDAFIKFRVFSEVLDSQGKSWTDLPREQPLFHELALLSQSYHAFCRGDSLFRQLELGGLLEHRLGPAVAPGAEPIPFVPGVNTRADVRARAILEHVHRRDRAVLDWSTLLDHRAGKCYTLADPFATQFTSLPENAGIDF